MEVSKPQSHNLDLLAKPEINRLLILDSIQDPGNVGILYCWFY